MRIITNLEALDIDQEYLEAMQAGPADMDQIRKWVFAALSEAFNDQSHDKETYLCESYTDEYFIFGAASADEVLSITQNWNLNIQAKFITALKDMKVNETTPETLPIDNFQTYDIQKAARELDNNWWDYADHGVYLPNSQGYPYFRVTLEKEELEDILKHPEQYIIVDVYVK